MDFDSSPSTPESAEEQASADRIPLEESLFLRSFDWANQAADRLQFVRGQLEAAEDRLRGTTSYSADNWEALMRQVSNELLTIAGLHRASVEVMDCRGSA